MMDTLLGLDYPTLWFLVVGGLFTGYAILDGFDFGAGAWHLFFRKETSRQVALQAVGPVWSGNEVWLVIGGGALFAGFPVAYSVVFSAMYVPFMLFLTVLILRAIAIEFRDKDPAKRWRRNWDVVYGVSSTMLPLLLGIVLGNVIQGLAIDQNLNYAGAGFLEFLNPYALLMGITAVSLVMMHGAIYLLLKSEGSLFDRLSVLVRWAIGFFIFTFVLTSVYTLLYLPNVDAHLRSDPVFFVILVLGLLSIANIPRLVSRKRFRWAFLFSSLSIAFMFGLVAIQLFPNLLVSTIDPANNIDIYKAASSEKSLKIMLLMVAIGGPLVLIYTLFVYRTFRGKVKLDKSGYE